jgi:hypothetical protein
MADVETTDNKASALVKNWMKEIGDANKREKKFRTVARDCVNLYEAKTPDATPFAILYSNTETLIPAVYNARPIPIVTRRYKDADPNGKAVAETSTRILKFLIDTQDKDYDSFDELMQPAVVDALVTNRGLTRFKFVAHEDTDAECVYGEAVRWDKFLHGYARTWKKVPWIAFEHDMSKDELKTNFPKISLGDLRKFTDENSDEDSLSPEDRDEMAGVKSYKVYEIWDKVKREVLFISGVSPDRPLRHISDPLDLTSFFPIPKPLNFMRKITTLIPTPLYVQYRSQAAELNELTVRLKAIIKAIKFRGAYNSTIEGIEKMLTADDNTLVPIENMASMPENTSIDKVFWTVPTNDLASTAQILYQQREQCKQVIYEITGISDILRGASVASETATAQNIKNQWGTLRLKRMQKEVQRYVRDALEIMLEIASEKFEVQTMRQMTGLQFFTNAEKQKVGQALQAQAAQAQAQQAMNPGQPAPPPPAPPPEVAEMMKAPSWEDITKTMQDGVIFHYKVDIETNSTIDAEAAQDKQDIADLMNAMSQFLNGIAPLVEQGVMPIEVAKGMLLVICRRFNFGSQIEDAINNMKPPEQKGDPAADAKAEQAKQEATLGAAKAQQEMQQMQLEGQLSQQEFEQKKQLMELQAQIDREKLELQREELAMQRAAVASKMALNAASHSQKMEQLAVKPKETTNA